MEGTKQRISLLAAAAVFVLAVAPFPVQSYPVVTTKHFSDLSRVSKYRDGFQVNGAGTAYTHYTVGGGAFQPLTQDLARIRFNPGRILRQRRSSRIRWA